MVSLAARATTPTASKATRRISGYVGYWSTPRYIVPFEEMILGDTRTSASFQFANPPDNVVLWVGLNFYSKDDLEALVAASAIGRARLEDSTGRCLLEVDGKLVLWTSQYEAWWPSTNLALVPPTDRSTRSKGQVLRGNDFADRGQLDRSKWSFIRDGYKIHTVKFVQLEDQEYSLHVELEVPKPMAAEIRFLPILMGGGRPVF